MSILEHIETPQDVKNLTKRQKHVLCGELRQEIITTVRENGGHLASNLGTVELTVALHSVFDTPTDKIVWDVGHQSYTHKLLTGRREQFKTLRQQGGMSGFPKRSESEHDAFDTGHSSTSISAALGLARARDLSGEDHSVIAVIGDGALTGGMSFEALSDAGDTETKLIVILNDNEMSISKNVGGLNKYLSRMRTSKKYRSFKRNLQKALLAIPVIGKGLARVLEAFKNRVKYFVLPSVYFEEIGFTYLGPIDGHDIEEMETVLRHARTLEWPVFIHVITQKGRGYEPAENNPEKYHGVAPFLVEKAVTGVGEVSNSNVFGSALSALAQDDERIIAVTAAMAGGTGLSGFEKQFPERFFDVGIAEQHAVTMCAGLAEAGKRPYFAVYSSFLQRAYDQVMHDVCVQNLPVTLCIDRAGITGEDGETHQGVFDIAFLRHLPNMTIFSPADQIELRMMIKKSLELDGPSAIRYPRGSLPEKTQGADYDSMLRWDILSAPAMITVVATGKMLHVAQQAVQALRNEGMRIGLINARVIKPLDERALSLLSNSGHVITLEDGSAIGGLGSAVVEYFANGGPTVEIMGIPDEFVTHGKVDDLLRQMGLDAASLVKRVRKAAGVKHVI